MNPIRCPIGVLRSAPVLALSLSLSFAVQADDAPAANPVKAITAPTQVPAKQPTTKPAKADKAAPKKASAAPLTPERERAALEFAQQNHPDLIGLLDGLKVKAPRQYQTAVLDLERTAERLAKAKEKSPEKYEHQLTEWKLTSRIRLLTAKLAISDDPHIETELRSAIHDRLELRLNLQRAERDHLRQRLEKLNHSIDESSAKLDDQVEQQMKQLRASVPKSAAKSKSKRPTVAADGKESTQ